MDTDVYPKSVDQIESWDFEADVVIAGYGIAGAAAAVEAASAGADVLVARAHRRLGRGGRHGGRVHLPRRRHRNPKGLWLRRFRRQHGRIPERGDGAGRGREPHRRLLRRQRRPFRLAGAVRRPVQAGVLGRARLGAARRRRPDVHRWRERLPVQHHRQTRSARPYSADVQQEGRRSQCRLHADEATRRHRHRRWACGRCTTSTRRR